MMSDRKNADREKENLIFSFDFEIHGKVQKVYFRKHTQETASNLNLRGWVKNTSSGTVIGTAQGESEKLEELKHWLSSVGSPKSRIDSAIFTNERSLSEVEFDDFNIDRRK